MINTIIDIYHGNSVNLQQVRDAGIVAVIHKATEGTNIRDSQYHQRRDQARQLGLLWGAYHFSTGASVSDQVENFLEHARPDDSDLISLDWEPSNGPDMSLAQARHFVQMIKDETGRWPVIYGGHLLREEVAHNADPILSNCPLWYARYANSPIGIPTQVWPTYTLWQYTDGDNGPQPHDTTGANGADRNIYQGTTEELRAAWPLTRRQEGAPAGPGISHMAAPQPALVPAPAIGSEAQQHEEFIDRLGLRYFRGNEFTEYWSRTRNGVTNSIPPQALWSNIIRTLVILDELRASFNAPITLTSTYRSPAYNAAIGGEPASFHMQYKAIDFQCVAGSPSQWAQRLRDWRGRQFTLPGNGGQFEFRGGVGKYDTFVHVDTRGYDANW